MGLKDVFANRKLAKIKKMQDDTKKTSQSISLGDSAQTEAMRNHFPKEVGALESYARQRRICSFTLRRTRRLFIS